MVWPSVDQPVSRAHPEGRAGAGASGGDPLARCLAERAARIGRMQADGMSEAAPAELFKTCAEAMCRAENRTAPTWMRNGVA
jgi:hypothetical protein